MRARNVIVLAAVALLAAACSVSRLAYLNAPPLALWYLGGYVDMSDAQKSLVRDRLTRALSWHRQRELPEYQHAIEQLIVKSDDGVSLQEARETYKLARDYYHRLVEHMLPDFADFLLSVDASQVARIENKFSDDIKKILKESVTGTVEERREKRAKKYIDQFEEYTGRLSSEQRELVAKRTRDLDDFTNERVGDRRYRQSEILRLIHAKPPRDEIVAKLRALLIDTESWRRPEYAKKLRDRDEVLIAIVADLSPTLTADQKTNLQKKMRGYVKDISSITASR
jgi:hypothetical protein